MSYMSSASRTNKYIVYRVAAVVFGAVFGFFLHVMLLTVVPSGENFTGLPFLLASLLAASVGGVAGVPLGKNWWRIVYVEKRGGLCRKL
jgi:hypothetical protein